MAFLITCKDETECMKIRHSISEYLDKSRFTAEVTAESSKRSIKITIRNVRLRISKDYCGNHAGPCRGIDRRHTKHKFLEGLDWISFNDMLNDALDAIEHRGSAASSLLRIRKAGKRRIEYDSCNENGEWSKEPPYYVDCIGKVPPETIYPSGTPGILGWRRE